MPDRVKLEREIWERAEMARCHRDPLYFFETYWHMQIVGKGWSKFNLRGYQKTDLVDLIAADKQDNAAHLHRLKARQVGWTTLAMSFAFHNAWFNSHHPWLNTAQSEGDAKETLRLKAKIPYSMLPAWMRRRGPKLMSDNSEQMLFDNGSYITSIPSTASSGRGQAVYGAIMDEAAFMQDAAELFGALDPMVYGMLIVFSTANGMGNWFHRTYLDALLDDSEWTTEFHSWKVVPERDQKWYDQKHRAYRMNPWVFYQEYPSTPTEAFAKSGRTAWDIQALEEEMDFRPPLWRLDLTLVDFQKPMGGQIETCDIPAGEDRELELWLWELPYLEKEEDGRLVRQPNFVVSVDTAEGLVDGDATAISIFDANLGEQVGSMVAQYPVDMLDDLVEWLGYWWYTALVTVERNGVGLVPIVGLQKKHYPRLFRMDNLGKVKKRRGESYGWITSPYTKPKMVLEFGRAVADGQVMLHDRRFLVEASSFVADIRGIFNAVSGQHDDAVMSTLIGVQAMLQVGRFPIVWVDDEERPLTMGEVFDLITPSLRKKKSNRAESDHRPIRRNGRSSPIHGLRGWKVN